jgi:hypothetical protein
LGIQYQNETTFFHWFTDPHTLKSISYVHLGQVDRPVGIGGNDVSKNTPQNTTKLHTFCRRNWHSFVIDSENGIVTDSAGITVTVYHNPQGGSVSTTAHSKPTTMGVKSTDLFESCQQNPASKKVIFFLADCPKRDMLPG